MKYLNTGSISAIVATVAGVLVALHPSLGPNFQNQSVLVITSLVGAVGGLVGIVDEVIAAFKSGK